jgi:predicted phosphohydrolase
VDARFQTREDVLERDHARIREHQRRVVVGTSGADCTTSWPCEPKYSRKDRRISFVEVMKGRLGEAASLNKHVSSFTVIVRSFRGGHDPCSGGKTTSP